MIFAVFNLPFTFRVIKMDFTASGHGYKSLRYARIQDDRHKRQTLSGKISYVFRTALKIAFRLVYFRPQMPLGRFWVFERPPVFVKNGRWFDRNECHCGNSIIVRQRVLKNRSVSRGNVSRDTPTRKRDFYCVYDDL